MDNLSSHKGPRVRAMIEAVRASMLYLPSYTLRLQLHSASLGGAFSCRLRPSCNLIENAFVKLKALLRKIAARTVSNQWAAIGRFIETFTPAECANYFAAAENDAA